MARRWQRTVHTSFAFVYLVAVVAGVYGLFRPSGQIYDLYGKVGNLTLVVVITASGALGLWAHLFRRASLELLSAPLLCTALVFIAPAMFYAEVKAHKTAWYGWLMVSLAASLVSRWADVRAMLERRQERRERASGRHRQAG